ncbi:hypothetical protein H6F43_05890 [Leptolyngbya sp. FACHB-36]|uniref:hypothetical protein n=1 Tax=Leptolyngbya sp. FACHB-36 TaxID=2692808 RepID=UPI001680C6EB|nr:hypothetical protein [Leptolyngbya sp. FACHB-36]MBD2019719.1 hypothetical protein [Leptolyngbya sp. FACHB-36]
MAKSGQGDRALETVRAIQDDDQREQVTVDLIDHLTTDDQREQAIALLGTINIGWKSTRCNRLAAEKLAFSGRLYLSDFPKSSRAVLLSRVAKEYRLLGEQKQALQSLGDALKMVQTFKPTWLKAEQLRSNAAEYKALGQSAKAAALSAQANKISPKISLPAPAKIPLAPAPARIPFPALKPRSAPKPIAPRSIILPAPVSR